ncbi:unnamed protein product, partial [Phaeothamnion confervicola]
MVEWTPARLIPTSGISGPDEQETRATSALLAVLTIVRDFSQSLLRPFGALAGNVETFIEVPLDTADGRTVRPDGLIRVTRGQRSWTALVEVKTGTNDLGREQLETYLDLARDNGFDAVLSISNQIAPSVGVHPVDVDKRKLRRVALHHLSWAEVVSTAVLQRVHYGLDDPEQAWILAELIRYLQHPRSGALDFTDMGASWVDVREAVASGTLRANDKGGSEVVSRWEQLLRFAALRLERDLGSGVQVALTRKEQADPSVRPAALLSDLASRGALTGSLRIPNTVGDLSITADLRTGRCLVEVDVPAPAEGRPLTRINWLLRQLSDAPEGLRVDAFAHMARTSTSELLRTVRADPGVLLADGKTDLRRFRIGAQSQLGTKRSAGRGGFIDSVLGAIDGFYGTVLQDLRPWIAKPPQRPKSGSVLADAGIDTSVLPGELADDDLKPDDANDDAGAADVEFSPDPLAPTSDSEAPSDQPSTEPAVVPDDELVSWDEQVDDIEQER